MPRPKKHITADKLRPRPRDLFGQVPITQDDLENWVRAVAPNYAHSAWRMRHYIDAWNIAAKVRAAKIDGTFYGLTDQISPPFDRCATCDKHPHAAPKSKVVSRW